MYQGSWQRAGWEGRDDDDEKFEAGMRISVATT